MEWFTEIIIIQTLFIVNKFNNYILFKKKDNEFKEKRERCQAVTGFYIIFWDISVFA